VFLDIKFLDIIAEDSCTPRCNTVNMSRSNREQIICLLCHAKINKDNKSYHDLRYHKGQVYAKEKIPVKRVAPEGCHSLDNFFSKKSKSDSEVSAIENEEPSTSYKSNSPSHENLPTTDTSSASLEEISASISEQSMPTPTVLFQYETVSSCGSTDVTEGDAETPSVFETHVGGLEIDSSSELNAEGEIWLPKPQQPILSSYLVLACEDQKSRGTKNRRFNPEWYREYPWIEYSATGKYSCI
jgi:hypothetical protein